MTNKTKFYRKFASWLCTACMAWFLAALAWAQTAEHPRPAPSTAPAQQTSLPREGPLPTPEPKISRAQAEELLRSVDEILRFVSQDTALPIRHEVKRRLIGREEVEAYVSKNTMEDENAKRLRRSELVLKKFGLLPRDFDLGKFLVALLKEQVAGYYDPKTKTVNLLDWLDAEQQKPVLAHELTHALQDQSFGLEKFMKPGGSDLEKKEEVTPQDFQNDEIGAARQAVVEGQAMAVLIDYMLIPLGQSLKDSPQLVASLKNAMLAGTADSVHFHDAPLYIRQALTFPYRYGIDFVAQVLAKGAKEKAFAGLLQNPPRTTREIMEPSTYLAGEHQDAMRLPDFRDIFRNYERFDVGAVGEFDVSVLIEQYASAEASRDLYPHWRGGYYYAARLKSDPGAPLALLYVSRWSNAERGAQFAAIYARSLGKRYGRVRDADGGKVPAIEASPLQKLNGTRAWLTDDGPVLIESRGDTVMVSESLDLGVTKRLQEEIFPKAVAAGK